MKIIQPLALLIPVVVIMSCGKPKPRPNYYFPVSKFNNITIYTYVNQRDTSEKSIWEMTGRVSGGDTLLRTSIFDTQHRITEIIEEKISGGNAHLVTYTLFNYDPEGKQLRSDCRIIDNNMFREDQVGGDTIRWTVGFNDPNDQYCELSKSRTLDLKLKTRKTFKDQFKLTIPEIPFTGQYSMVSTYAADTGIVAFTMNLPGGFIKEFKLVSWSERH